MGAHVIIEGGARHWPPGGGSVPVRGCAVCEMTESIAAKHPDCKGRPLYATTTADAKTAGRRSKRRKRKR
jgi:hypothetical protein